MQDVQSERDLRGMALSKVGVSSVLMPLLVEYEGAHPVAAQINFSVALAAGKRAIHMSRLMEILMSRAGQVINPEEILKDALARLQAEGAHLTCTFPIFVEEESPVTKRRSLLAVQCEYSGEVAADTSRYVLSLTVPLTTLCPCSKAISACGAHNQRAKCRARLTFTEAASLKGVDISWLARTIARQGSAPVYGILKREDEKFVTEQAYANAKFVEDVVRDVAKELKAVEGLAGLLVECISEESIHNHNAFAVYEEVAT